MQKSWSVPQLYSHGTIQSITKDVTVTCSSNEKRFGIQDGFLVGGTAVGCS